MANKGKIKSLREDITNQVKDSPLKVDRQKNVIRDVKILGWHSKNKNRRYSQNGVDPALYEGAVVNIDHADAENPTSGPRPLAARFGEVKGIHKNNDGLFAKELHYNPKHPLAESILWMAENKPHLFGCSQNAFGDVYEDGTGEIVETVTDVRSIDLVSEPATTKGLHEGVKKTKEAQDEEDELPPDPDADEVPIDDEGPPVDDADVGDDIPLGGPDEAPPGGEEPPTDDMGLAADEDMDDTGMDDMGADDAAPGAGGGIDISDETLAIMTKVLNSNLDPKAKKKKIASLIDTHHNMMQEAVMKTSTAVAKRIKTLDDAKKHLIESKDPAVRKAAKAVVGTLDRHEVAAKMKSKQTLAESLCARAKLPKEAVTPFFLSQLVECADEKRMMEAIEDRRQITGLAQGKKPRSVDPLTEGVRTEDMSADDLKKHEAKMEADFLKDVFRGVSA